MSQIGEGLSGGDYLKLQKVEQIGKDVPEHLEDGGPGYDSASDENANMSQK